MTVTGDSLCKKNRAHVCLHTCTLTWMQKTSLICVNAPSVHTEWCWSVLALSLRREFVVTITKSTLSFPRFRGFEVCKSALVATSLQKLNPATLSWITPSIKALTVWEGINTVSQRLVELWHTTNQVKPGEECPDLMGRYSMCSWRESSLLRDRALLEKLLPLSLCLKNSKLLSYWLPWSSWQKNSHKFSYSVAKIKSRTVKRQANTSVKSKISGCVKIRSHF